MIALGIIFIVIGSVLLGVGRRHRAVHSDMRVIDRMMIRELRPGIIAEISGVAQLEPPRIAPFSGMPCVWYECVIERLEYISGKQGETWHPIWQERTKDRFHISDGTGSVGVTPEEAAIDAPQIFERTIEPGDVFPRPEFRDLATQITGYRARVRERALAVGNSVYVFGSVFSSMDKMYMMRGRRPLYISTKPEELIEQEIGRKAAIFTLGGLIAALGGAALIFLNYLL
ncbi:MAG: GIDE domain-containing protein [Patescibacteria group bacterium]|jgi:hypothetical protein